MKHGRVKVSSYVSSYEAGLLAEIRAAIREWRHIEVSDAEVVRTAIRAYHADYIAPYQSHAPTVNAGRERSGTVGTERASEPEA